MVRGVSATAAIDHSQSYFGDERTLVDTWMATPPYDLSIQVIANTDGVGEPAVWSSLGEVKLVGGKSPIIMKLGGPHN